jgi:undecaprenyl-diphosphatase
MNIDFFVFHLLNQFAGKNNLLDGAAIFFAEYFQYVILISLLAILFINFKKNLPMFISSVAAVFLSRIVITEVIRHFFFKLRPFAENQATVLIDQSPKEASMPSGHATLFFALAMAVYFYNKKLGIIFFVSAFLISVSRVFAGVHWPSDILAGAFIGIFCGWLVVKIFRNFFQKFSDKIFSILTKKKP